MKVLTILAIAALLGSLQAHACPLQPNGATNQPSLSSQNNVISMIAGPVAIAKITPVGASTGHR